MVTECWNTHYMKGHKSFYTPHTLSILWYIEWNISNQDTNGAVESEVSSAMHNAHKSGS